MNQVIEMDKMRQLRFPVGIFEFGKVYTEEEVQQMIRKIDEFPVKLKRIIAGLTREQLDSAYRQDGWTIRQVIHHLADSHINAYIRFRLALTEDMPTIKPYDQEAWANLEDAKNALPALSIELLYNLHKRWSILLKSMTADDFERLFYHPEHQMSYKLREILAMYVWHGEHHYAHILKAKEKFTAKTKVKKVTSVKAVADKGVKSPVTKKPSRKKDISM